MKSYVEEIEFRATAPRRALPGLEYAEQKLLAISAALKAVQGQLAGTSTQSIFRKSAAQFERNIRAFTTRLGETPYSKGPVAVSRVARMLGFPDLKDVRRMAEEYARDTEREVSKLQRRLDKMPAASNSYRSTRARVSLQNQIRKLREGSFFTDATGRTFQNPKRAGEFFERYSGPALKNIQRGEAALNALLGGAMPGPGMPFVPASPALAPRSGPIPAPEGKTSNRKKRKGGGEGASESERSPAKEFQDALAAVKREMAEQIVGEAKMAGKPGAMAGTANLFKLANIKERAAAQIKALSEGDIGRAVGPGKMVDAAMTHAATLLTDAENDRQKAMKEEGKSLGRTRKALADARARSDKEEIKRLESEKRAHEKRLREMNRVFYGPKAKADAEREKREKRVADFEREQAQAKAFRRGSYLGAKQFIQDLMQRGATMVGGRAPGGRKPPNVVYELAEGDKLRRYTVTWGKKGADIEHTVRPVKKLKERAGWLGSDFLTNTAKVTKWAASVTLLYKSVELARYSFEQFLEVGGQVARLDQIFNKVGGSTRALTSDVLNLAAANGRDSQEAMESAISWSRLGLNRLQVAQAVRLSLIAANVTQLSAADTTEHLQAIMQNYGLTVGDLSAKLGEMVRISNIYNVTNADMLQGVSRTAAVAKQAGMPFEELIGLIGATVGATKQSGANIGNAIKTIITTLGNPALQQKLKLFYGISSEGAGGQKKNVSDTLNEIFVRYQRLDDLQKRAMLFSIGGKFQSSRLSAMLDNYVRAQVLAIDAQLHLNTAEQENLKIIGSLKAQLQGLTTEWDRFVQIQGANGPAQALSQIAEAFRHVLSLMNSPGGKWLVTGMLGLSAAAMAKTALTGLSIAGTSGSQSFWSRTKATAATEAAALNRVATTAVTRYANDPKLFQSLPFIGQTGFAQKSAQLFGKGVLYTDLFGRSLLSVARSAEVSSRSVRLFFVTAGAGLRTLALAGTLLGEFLVPLVVVTGGIWAFNKAMDALEGNTEEGQKKLAGFNEEMERAAAAANAMGQASNLFNTAIKSFSPMAGYGMISIDNARRMLDQLSTVTFLDEPDLSKRSKMQQQWAQQTAALYQQGNQMAVLNALEQQRNTFILWRKNALQAEFEAQQKSIQELTSEKASLEAQQKGVLSRFGYQSRQDRLGEIDQQLAQAQGQLVQNVQDQLSETDDLLSTDQRVVAEMEKQKTLAQTIADIFGSMQTANPMEKWYADVASKSAQVLADQKRMQELMAQSKMLDASDAQKDAINKKLDDQIATLRQKIADVHKQAGDTAMVGPDGKPYPINLDDAIDDEINPVSLFQTPRAKVAKDQADKLQSQIDSIEQQKKDLNERGVYIDEDGHTNLIRRAVIQKQMADVNKDQIERQNELDALKAARQLRQDQFEMQMGEARGKREIAPFDFGRDKTDKMWRQYQALQVQINNLGAPQGLAKQVDLQGKLNQDIQLSLDLRQRAAEIEAEISQHVMDQQREFSKPVLGAGPEEMLRKLSAFRLAFDGRGNLRNTSQGQFFSMSSGMRSDFGMLNPRFDPEMIELKNERKRVADIISKLGGDKGMDASIKTLTDKWGAIADSLAKRLSQDTPSYNAAAQVMDRFDNSVQQAANTFKSLADYVASKVNQPGGGGHTQGGAPQVVQGGGLGGGAGYR
ncbi:MAG TPA: phage tail tape measure protein [Verrucomicrobiae bacterium]|nr:phage tail tape measure protein [Verrucomicrobiae bacterium]